MILLLICKIIKNSKNSVTDWFIRGRKLSTSLVYIAQS